MPDKSRITSRDEKGEIVADSCVIYLFFDQSKSFGDSTTAMKLKISELDHPVADGMHYSNFDPVKEGYIRQGRTNKSHLYTFDDMTIKDSVKNGNDYTSRVLPSVSTSPIQTRTVSPIRTMAPISCATSTIIRSITKTPMPLSIRYVRDSISRPLMARGLMSYFASAQFSVYYTYGIRRIRR